MVKIVELRHEPFCNSYIVGEEGKPCLLVDPGFSKEGYFLSYCGRHHSSIEGILITHAHIDHFGGLEELATKTKAPIFLGFSDIPALGNPSLNASLLFGESISYCGREPLGVSDNDEINLANLKIQVIDTPFHTKGSVCYFLPEEGILFSGDSLFHLGVGRTDLAGGCPRFMESSLSKLKKLPLLTKVFAGHGESTTIGNEMRFNDYFK